MSNTISFNVDMSEEGIAQAISYLTRLSLNSSATIITVAVEAAENLENANTTQAVADPEEEFNQNAPAVDSAGIPWDGRIHSENKTTNKDGTWRNKRGVDPAIVAQVMDELRGAPAPVGIHEAATKPVESFTTTPAPIAAATPPAPPAPVAPPPAPPAPAAEVRYKHGDQFFTYAQLKSADWTDEQINSLERETAAPAPGPTPAPAAAMTFAEVMYKVNTSGMSISDVVNPKVAEIAARMGKPEVTSIALLASPANAAILSAVVPALWPSA